MKKLGEDFIWWYGVVEDRADPLELGRVRVRCYGWHTDDLKEIPTDSLPWAQPIQDITSAALGGIGKSATGILEGTWVVGFFADGEDAQRPIVMGTVAGIPTNTNIAGEDAKGFQDPTGKYPRTFDIPDTPVLARDNAEDDEVMLNKRSGKLESVPTATAPDTTRRGARLDGDYAVDEVTDEDTRPTWAEPNPRYGGETKDEYPEEITTSATYPYNHVYRSESGHVFEVDDSPGVERIHQYHRTGTFQEIQPDGTRMTKVVGRDYSVTVGDNNVYVQGNQTVTIAGNCKLYVQGDHYTEVDGNQYITVRGDRVTKIQGNDKKEVMTDEVTQINGNKTMRVTGDRKSIIDGNYTETIGKDNKIQIKKNEVKTIFVNSKTTVTGNTNIFTIKNMQVGSGQKMGIGAGTTYDLKVAGAATMDFDSTLKERVTGASHLTFSSTHFVQYGGINSFTHVGDRKIFIKADTFARHDAGTDHACSSDPSRSSANDCSTPETPTAP